MMKRAIKEWFFYLLRWAVFIVLVLHVVGCGDNVPADQCYVAPDWNVGYQDCGVRGCVTGCGVLPQDGSPGHLLPAGCTVEIGTASTAPALCVNSCDECH